LEDCLILNFYKEMAKASWAVVVPSQGSGNATVSVSTHAPHTGRKARTTVLTITAANVEAKTVNVTQQGILPYVDVIDNATIGKEGGFVGIQGTANSAKLIFSLGSGDLDVALPLDYLAAGELTNNGEFIKGDPGATAEYEFSIFLSFDKNTSTTDRSRQIIVTDENGNSDVCLLTMSAGDPTLTVSKNSIELSAEGTPVSFEITSNTSWVIS
jgi:hypothetical protein